MPGNPTALRSAHNKGKQRHEPLFNLGDEIPNELDHQLPPMSIWLTLAGSEMKSAMIATFFFT